MKIIRSFQARIAFLSSIVSVCGIGIFCSFLILFYLLESSEEVEVISQNLNRFMAETADTGESSQICEILKRYIDEIGMLRQDKNDTRNIITVRIIDKASEAVFQIGNSFQEVVIEYNGLHTWSHLFSTTEVPFYYREFETEKYLFRTQVVLFGLKVEFWELVFGLLLAMPFTGVFVFAGAWLLSRNIVAPLNQIADLAERMDDTRLSERIPEQDHSLEISRLVMIMNRMIARLERSFNQAKRFSADASHELKTPIAILKLTINDAIRNNRYAEKDNEYFSVISNEVDRLDDIIQCLNILNKSDSGKLVILQDKISVQDLLDNVMEDASVLAEIHAIDLRASHIEVGSSIVLGDQRMLSLVFENLISNAIKYNLPSNGWIQISAEVQDKKLHIRVSNSGEDISMDEQTRIFDRFYRARRKTVIHGSGLGLSLAREIIRAHHGEIQLIKSANEMTEFELIFPVKNEA